MKRKERLLIITDAEGCHGFRTFNEDGGARAMDIELENALSVIDMSKYEVTIVDAHAHGHNLDEEGELYKENNIRIVRHIWGLKKFDFDMAVILGMHAMAGSECVFSHTLRSEIADVKIGEESVGEASLIRNWLAFYSLPVVFIAGSVGIEDEISRLGIKYYVHTDSECSLKNMARKMSDALKEKVYSPIYYTEKVSMRFEDELFLEFMPHFLGKKEGEFVVFPSTKYLFDVFPCISILIESAISLRNTVLRSLRIHAKDNRQLFIECDEGIRRLAERSYKSLIGCDLVYLLYEFERMQRGIN